MIWPTTPTGSRRIIDVKPLDVLAGGAALEAPRGAREEPQVVDHERDLVVAEGVDRLAGVVGLELGELVGVLLDRVGELQHAAARSPGVVTDHSSNAARAALTARSTSSAVERRLGDRLAGGGVEDRLGLPSAGSTNSPSMNSEVRVAVATITPTPRWTN